MNPLVDNKILWSKQNLWDDRKQRYAAMEKVTLFRSLQTRSDLRVKWQWGLKQKVGLTGGGVKQLVGKTALRQDQTSTWSNSLIEVQTRTCPKAV